MDKQNEYPGEILIVAAEESSALYAKRLLEQWKSSHPHLKFYGVGSREMEKLNFEILGRSEEMAVMGLAEILSHWSQIKTAYKNIIRRVDKGNTRFALLMDYPGFNLRLAKDLKRRGVKVFYYVPPQVWAWKTGRVNTIRKYVDKVFVLFPFEKEFFDRHQVSSEFVGHPLLDEIDEKVMTKEYQKLHRARYGIGEKQILLGLMPGSRRSEIKYNLQAQLDTAKILREKFPELQVAVLLAPNFKKENFPMPKVDFPITLMQAPPFEMISLCDAILCASGTATLMVGLMEKPMLIMYKAHPISVTIGRWVLKIKFFGLVNILLGREAVPERLQEKADPREMARLISELLSSSHLCASMVADLKTLKSILGQKGAGLRVAKSLEAWM